MKSLPDHYVERHYSTCSSHRIMTSRKKILLHPPATPSSSSSSVSLPCVITRLNREQLITILQLLPVYSIIAFSMTCKEFRSLGCSEILWEYICKREWGALQHFNSPIRSWKRLFEQVSQMSSVRFLKLFVNNVGEFLPEPRASHSLIWVQDRLLLFGGGCHGGRHLGDTWVATVGTITGAAPKVTWQPVNSDGPTGRFGHTCTVVGDLFVLFGGINDNGTRQNDTWIGQVVVEDRNPITPAIKLSWTLMSVIPDVESDEQLPCPRGAHAGCIVGEDDNKMVIHGGIGPNSVRLDDLWLLKISKDSFQWRRVIPTTGGGCGRSPSPRSGHSLTWIRGNQMVLFGGRGIGHDVLNDVWILNLTDLNCPFWVEIRLNDSPSAPIRIPPPRVGHSASLMLGSRVVVYGGEDSQRRKKNDFWVLDVSKYMQPTPIWNKEVWTKLEIQTTKGAAPQCRSFHTACADLSGRYFYVFGGMVNDDGIAHRLVFDGNLYLLEFMLDT